MHFSPNSLQTIPRHQCDYVQPFSFAGPVLAREKWQNTEHSWGKSIFPEYPVYKCKCKVVYICM